MQSRRDLPKPVGNELLQYTCVIGILECSHANAHVLHGVREKSSDWSGMPYLCDVLHMRVCVVCGYVLMALQLQCCFKLLTLGSYAMVQ